MPYRTNAAVPGLRAHPWRTGSNDLIEYREWVTSGEVIGSYAAGVYCNQGRWYWWWRPTPLSQSEYEEAGSREEAKDRADAALVQSGIAI